MKKFLTILLIYFFILTINAQFEEKEATPAVEIFFITENLPSSPIGIFTLSANSIIWGNTWPNSNYPGIYYLTNNFNEDTYIPLYNNMGPGSAGFDFISSQQGYPIFAYGLYKVTSNITDKYFHIDYRDQRVLYYPEFNPPTNGHNIDIWIKYNYNGNTFSYSSHRYDDDSYILIDNTELLNIWDIKEKGNPLTDLFPDYWQNSLALIDDNFHPKLIWSTDANVNVTHYKIYRSVSWIDEEEPSNDFVYLKQVNSSTGSFVDYSAVIGDKIKIWYKVKAFNGATEVEELNIVNHPYKYVVDWLGKSVILSIINNRPVLKFNSTIGNSASNEPNIFKIYRATKDYQNAFFNTTGLEFPFLEEITHNPLSPDTIKTYIDTIHIPSNKHLYYYIEAKDRETFVANSSILGLRNSEYSWDENLYLTDDSNNRPKLIWGPHPNHYYMDIVNYKIFHSFHMFGTPPGTFSLLATVSGDTCTYVHQNVNLGSGDLITYYITAIINDESENTFETTPSNTVTARLDNSFKINNEKENVSYVYKNELFPNYPNPFNPVTNIKYQIKEKGYVTLKVFDILGKEIVTLVNDYKEAGEYSVDFSTGSIGDGISLPSGVYVYSLKVNDYYENRKMSLVK